MKAVSSLARDPSLVEVVVGLDDDDPDRHEAEDKIGHLPGVRILTCPRMMCQAAYYNHLAKQATHDWVGIFADDYTVDQDDWASIMETTLAALPNGYGFGYFHDPMYPFFSTYPFMNKATMALQIEGKFLPEFFPFLFGDTWINEIGVMATFILPSKASVTIQPETGHVHRFRDLRMWSEFFHETRPLRAQIAQKMIQAATGTETNIYNGLMIDLPKRAALVDRLFRESSMTEDFFQRMENNGWEGQYVHPEYEAMKQRTLKFLELNRRDAA